MHFFEFIIIALYAFTGTACIAILLKILIEACIGSPAGWRERARLKSLKRGLANLSARFQENNFAGAKQGLHDSFHFDIIRNDAEVIEQVNSYHHSLLQHILQFGKAHTLTVSSFEVLEDLLLSRTPLLRSYFEAELNRRALQKKGVKKVPGWALEEYSKKISDLREKLITNQKSILLQFEKSVSPDSPKPISEEIIYH